MAELSDSPEKKFICSCQQEFLFKHQILDHLKQKTTHNIRKLAPLQSLKDFKNSIFNKIANIEKTQIKIQVSSNQLIQTITKNTSVIIQKLSNIINLYKHFILNPPLHKVIEIKNLELANTFRINLPLYTALTQHFAQQAVSEKSTLETVVKKVKSQVIDIKKNHIGAMICMAVFSDEKRVVTGGNDGAVRVWNLETKSQIWFILKHKDQIFALALGKEENLVLTGSADTSVRLWNIKLKSQVHKFVGHTEVVVCVLFSQDQSTGFSGSVDKTIRSWNLKSLAPQRTINFKTFIQEICLIREEKIIVACAENGSVSFFNFESNKHSNTQSHHMSNIKRICFTPNEDQFITGSQDGTVELWLTNGLKRHYFQKKHSAGIRSIRISNCYKLFATGSDDLTVIVWDFKKFNTIKIIQNQSLVSSLYFVKSSKNLLICLTYEINWCNLSTFLEEEKIKAKSLNSIAISLDWKYVAYGLNHICLIEIQNKIKFTKSSYIKGDILCLKFSSNSEFLGAGCYEGKIAIFSVSNLVILYTLFTNLSIIIFLSFSKNNELIGFCDGSTSVKVITIKTKEKTYENKGQPVFYVCFCSNDEKFVYSDNLSVFVLTKNFTYLTKIVFSYLVKKFFVNEDDSHVLVSHSNSRWSIIKAESLKKIFECKDRKNVKEWCTKRQDITFRVYLSFFN